MSNFKGLMTLTLDWIVLHTVMHHSLISTYMPNITEIKETFRGWTDRCKDGHLRLALLGRMWRSQPKNAQQH